MLMKVMYVHDGYVPYGWQFKDENILWKLILSRRCGAY